MLDQIRPLVEAGFAVHWLKEWSKAPVENLWTTVPVKTFADLTRTYRAGLNVGLRLGEPSRVASHYLHVIDLDIRVDAQGDAARGALARFIPNFNALPFVISGSGGQSRHFYFLTETPFSSRKLAHSDEKFTDAEGKKHWNWEAELFGTGKQVAIPPSIHPDTGKPYVWGREIELDDLDIGIGPFIPAATVATWAPASRAAVVDEDDDDGLSAVVRAKPLGLSAREIAECLAALPKADYCDDRDGWLTVGMALHHEFEGSAAGLSVWNTFSAQSEKYDEKDQARVWKSFESSRRPTRMATLIKAAAAAKFKAESAALAAEDADDSYGDDIDLTADDDEETSVDDDDDLLGPTTAFATGKVDLDWQSLFDLNEEGAIKPTLHNTELMVRNDVRVVGLPAYNEFTQEVMLRGKAGRMTMAGRKRAKRAKQLSSDVWRVKDPVSGDLWLDEHDYGVRSLFEAPKTQGGYGIKVSDRDLRAAVNIVAGENRFHPVREYLNKTVWDGVERLDTLFCRYLGADDTAYSRSVSRLTLLGAVVRAFEPGHKFDFVAIFEGLQGKRKSTFIDILARHWFAEIEGNFEDRKAMVEKMQGAWILELPELQGFGKHEVSIIKAFVSARVDKVRLAYAHRARNYERQCIFIGSTNDSTYLRDETGGRRFWPIACQVEEIDTAAFTLEVDQVWAEAVVAYRAMRAAQPFGTLPLFISDAAAKAEAAAKQEDRRVVDVSDELAGRIGAWLEKPMTDEHGFDDEDLLGGGPVYRKTVCSMEVWVEMLGEPVSRYGAQQQQQIGRALKKVSGWAQAGQIRTEKYGKQRAYVRLSETLARR